MSQHRHSKSNNFNYQNTISKLGLSFCLYENVTLLPNPRLCKFHAILDLFFCTYGTCIVMLVIYLSIPQPHPRRKTIIARENLRFVHFVFGREIELWKRDYRLYVVIPD